jgi:Phosphohistidine phosphatase SixA
MFASLATGYGGDAMKIKYIGILAVLAAGMLTCPLSVGAQEVIFIVRHSDPPAVLNLDEIKDETPLSESGQQRARRLAEQLKDAGITAIYATQARRTVETAQPLAKAIGIEIRIHSYEDTNGLVHRLRSEHAGDRVLVVGHWSTIPEILKALGYRQEVQIERSAYDNLFVVIPNEAAAPTVLHFHY